MDLQELIELLPQLSEFELKKVFDLVSGYVERKKDEGIRFEHCPKCGARNPTLIKGGRSTSGKQLYRCKECGRRFTCDHGSVTYSSKLSDDVWMEALSLVLGGATLTRMEEGLNVSRVTAHSMRHKILNALETAGNGKKLSGIVELDEKYVLKSHKGMRLPNIKGRRRGGRASRRGVSDEQLCIMTAVQREGMSYAKSWNLARPGYSDVLKLAPHIAEKTYLFTDGLNSYSALADRLGSDRKVLMGKEDYDSLNHLNTVNSFHSRISSLYAGMRGVASKYINRYATLFHVLRDEPYMDGDLFTMVKRKIMKVGTYISREKLKVDNIFKHPKLVWE